MSLTWRKQKSSRHGANVVTLHSARRAVCTKIYEAFARYKASPDYGALSPR